MKNLYKVISVFFILSSAHSWAMLAPKGNLRGFSEKKMPVMTPVLSRSFHEHQVMIKNLDKKEDFIEIDTAKGFIHSLGGQRLDFIQENLALLPKEEAIRALCILNDKKTLSDTHQLIWEIGKHRDIRLCILTKLFQGNTEMAHQCCSLPIDQVLEHYTRAQKMMIAYPIAIGKKQCREGHYVGLMDSQARVLSKALQDKTIYESDVNEFMHGIEILGKIDSSLMNDKNKKDIMSFVRIYPSLGDRIDLFEQTPGSNLRVHTWNKVALLLLLASKAEFFLGSHLVNTMYPYYSQQSIQQIQDEINVCQVGINKFLLPSGLIFAGDMVWKYWNYSKDLKDNFIPKQPTLTDYLKKSSS